MTNEIDFSGFRCLSPIPVVTFDGIKGLFNGLLKDYCIQYQKIKEWELVAWT